MFDDVEVDVIYDGTAKLNLQYTNHFSDKTRDAYKNVETNFTVAVRNLKWYGINPSKDNVFYL